MTVVTPSCSMARRRGKTCVKQRLAMEVFAKIAGVVTMPQAQRGRLQCAYRRSRREAGLATESIA